MIQKPNQKLEIFREIRKYSELDNIDESTCQKFVAQHFSQA